MSDKVKKIINIGLLGVSAILVVLFVVMVLKDYNEYNVFMSSPFYVYVIIRGLEFILPTLILIGIYLTLRKK